MTHTKGPWKVATGRLSPFYHGLVAYMGCSDANHAVGVVCDGGRPALDVEANARLISAAPDLLEAAKYILQLVSNGCGLDPLDTAMLRDVIAKAEGRSPTSREPVEGAK